MSVSLGWRIAGAAALAALLLGGLYQWRNSAVSVGIAETKTEEYKGTVQRHEAVVKKREQVKHESVDNRREVDRLSAGAVADELMHDYSRSSN